MPCSSFGDVGGGGRGVSEGCCVVCGVLVGVRVTVTAAVLVSVLMINGGMLRLCRCCCQFGEGGEGGSDGCDCLEFVRLAKCLMMALALVVSLLVGGVCDECSVVVLLVCWCRCRSRPTWCCQRVTHKVSMNYRRFRRCWWRSVRNSCVFIGGSCGGVSSCAGRLL